jgi:hypothetical protein
MIHLSPAQGAVNENQIRQFRYLKKPSLTNGKEKRFFADDKYYGANPGLRQTRAGQTEY